LLCRIFRELDTTVNRYFILYDLEKPDIVGGAEYLRRLDAPTPWSQRVMPRLRNFARGGGRVIASAGIGQGGLMAIVRLDTRPEWEADRQRARDHDLPSRQHRPQCLHRRHCERLGGPHLLRNRCDWPCAAVLGYAHSMTLELKAHPHMLRHAYGYALANKGFRFTCCNSRRQRSFLAL